jgi:hypothetical protein
MPKTTETKLKATPQFIGARILLCQTLNLETIFLVLKTIGPFSTLGRHFEPVRF